MNNPVVIFGANYLGRSAKEIFEKNGNTVYCFLDDNKALHGSEVDTITVLGNTEDDGFLKLIGKKCEAFIAIDDNKVRKSLVKILHEVRKVQPVNAVHNNVTIPDTAHIGHGNLIDSGVKIGTGAKVSNHCLLHVGVIIGAEAIINDFVQIGAGSIINPGVEVDEDAFVGSGVTIITGVKIGKGARVGAGSVVISSVKPGETVFGNPAQSIKS